MPDAMKLVRAELGNEAVILNSKVIYTGGFLGFFKKKSIEVIAAIDPKSKQEVNQKLQEKTKKPIDVKYNALNDTRKGFRSDEASVFNPTVHRQTEELLKEVSNLKKMMMDLANEREQVPVPGAVQEIMVLLSNQEISAKLKDEYLGILLEKWYLNGASSSRKQMLAVLKEAIIASILEKPFGAISYNKKFVNVVGPTGVGKTTTLAKIAAESVLKYKKKVAFITTDTYRISAIEQLKTYAKILNVPIEVCYNLEDFQAAAEKFKDYDLVLVDTAGRNFRNKKYVEELQNVIDFKDDIETYLVLALTAKQKDMEDIYEQFSLIGIDKLIFTKADETSVYGPMINMLEQYDIGVAYIANGQNVPDDMVVASPENITNYLLGDM
jgi:flagellar biosynthesis protein FlhF